MSYDLYLWHGPQPVTTQRAMAICGLTGYRNQSSVSMSRIMRDAAAAPLMVNNDRALQAMAQTLLVRKEL